MKNYVVVLLAIGMIVEMFLAIQYKNELKSCELEKSGHSYNSFLDKERYENKVNECHNLQDSLLAVIDKLKKKHPCDTETNNIEKVGTLYIGR